MSKSVLRRLAVQLPESEQPAFLAATFSLSVLKDSVAIAEGGLTLRALDVAYECPKCGTTLEKGGWCEQHGLPAQPRQ